MPRELTSMEDRKRLALGLPPEPKDELPSPDEAIEEVVMVKTVVGDAPTEPEPEPPEVEAPEPVDEPEPKPKTRGRRKKTSEEQPSDEEG